MIFFLAFNLKTCIFGPKTYVDPLSLHQRRHLVDCIIFGPNLEFPLFLPVAAAARFGKRKERKETLDQTSRYKSEIMCNISVNIKLSDNKHFAKNLSRYETVNVRFVSMY